MATRFNQLMAALNIAREVGEHADSRGLVHAFAPEEDIDWATRFLGETAYKKVAEDLKTDRKITGYWR